MKFLEHLKPNTNIVALTGAGISAESGLKTFRGQDGLWEGHRVQDVATPEAFIADPNLVQNFYNQRRAQLLSSDVQPNTAHEALAKLEKNWPDINGGSATVITQNIDDLHERCGSQNVIHMHGALLKMFCTRCADDKGPENTEKYDITTDITQDSACPLCGAQKTLRPDIVWFGEMPYDMERIYDDIESCDLFLSIGTSGHVYPAANFVSQAQFSGAYTAEVNLEPSLNASNFHEGIYGPATQQVPELCQQLLETARKSAKRA